MGIESIKSAGAISYQSSATKQADQKVAERENFSTSQTVENSVPTEKQIVSNSSSKENDDSYNNNEQSTQQKQNEVIRSAVDKINKNNPNTEAVFGVHEKTNRVTIKIVDKESKEVIKEFPPEKTLDLIAKAWELAGILVDEKR